VGRSAFFLTILLLAASGLSSAAPEDLARTVSANEKMIARFRGELSGADARKRAELEAKIKRLETQNSNLLRAVPPAAPAAPAGPARKAMEDLKGSDWPRLSESEKQRFVYTGIGGLERQGVFVMRPPQDYVEALGKILGGDAAMQDEYLEDLFVFCVYDAEPQTREAIERIRERSTNAAPGV
jgi:hypothetical protein